MTLEEFDKMRPFIPPYAKVYVHIILPPTDGAMVPVDCPPPKYGPGTAAIPEWTAEDFEPLGGVTQKYRYIGKEF